MDTNELKYLLKKYQDDSCTEEERELINRWIDEQKGNGSIHEESVDERLRSLKSTIDKQIAAKPVRYWRFLNVAALIFLLGSGFLLTYTAVFNKKPVIVSKVKKVQRNVKNGWVKLSTPKGIKHFFVLPDGSSVNLNASSSIRYPERFDGDARVIYLDEGEAYFAVARDKRRPFTVYTTRLATTALGTAFNVRAYQKERQTSVALIHGKVRVEDLRAKAKDVKPNILEPSQRIIVSTTSAKATSKMFKNEAPVIGWKEGILSFEEASVDEVITSIENRFDVTIINKAEKSDWKYTGTFHDESLEEILKTICITEGITYNLLSTDSIQLN